MQLHNRVGVCCPLTTQTLTSMPATVYTASFIPAVPRTSEVQASLSLPVSQSLAVLSAASVTPPVAPKMTAALVSSPSGESNSSSGR